MIEIKFIELSFKLSKETSKRLLLESDFSVCKKELDAAVSRVLELSK